MDKIQWRWNTIFRRRHFLGVHFFLVFYSMVTLFLQWNRHSIWRRKWPPTPAFLPGESQGWGSLVGCCLWGHRVGHDWSDLAGAAALLPAPCTLLRGAGGLGEVCMEENLYSWEGRGQLNSTPFGMLEFIIWLWTGNLSSLFSIHHSCSLTPNSSLP